MGRYSTFAAIVALAGAGGLGARAERPEQFRAWGTAGPDLPAVPAGWREAPPPEAPAVTWAPTAEDRSRGFVLFVRDALEPVGPRDRGFAAEQARPLRIFATLGEYEPAAVALHALAALRGVRVEVEPLRGSAGAIAADQVDVRVSRCVRTLLSAADKTFRLEPFLLERREAFDVAAGRTRQIWLTVRVPASAKAGRYRGGLRVAVPGRPAARKELVLDVLPFRLPAAPIEMAVCYPRPPTDDALLTKQLVDVREHGCNGVEPALEVQIETRDRKYGADDVAATRAHCRRMLRATRAVFGPRRHPVTFGVGHQIAYYWDRQKNWFAFWPHDAGIERDLLRAVDVVCEAARAERAPPLRVYALDEAGAHNLLDEAAHYYGLLKRERPALTRWTTIGGGIAMGSDEIGRLSDCVDFLATNRFTPDIARQLVRRARPYGIYNGCRNTPASARFFYGWHAWKTGAAQVLQWCYHFGNGVFEGGGIRQSDAGYVYLAQDGPLPSLMWEAVREGIDDYRYVELLRRRIAAAKASGKPGAAAAAARANETLLALLGAMDWGFQALQHGDRSAAPHASALRKWRRRVAGAIIELEPFAGGAGPDGPAPKRPSPLALPWRGAAKAARRYGPELLPQVGFEAGLAPWRIEAWKGPGQGRQDREVRRTGKASVRVDVAAGAAADAVTVLVWPSWGERKLAMRLGGGRTYELSAWVRCRARSVLPDPRIALPAGAARSTRTGQDPLAEGPWRRVWTRVVTDYPVVPKYLAVWVQGAGTVWVDDVSLRELLPAPVTLRLDQDEYDGLDAVALASVAVGRDQAPARVRFRIAREGGEEVCAQTAAFRARLAARGASALQRGAPGAVFLGLAELRRCEVLFGAATLPPGRYEAKVELLDADGAVRASAARPFVRRRDE